MTTKNYLIPPLKAIRMALKSMDFVEIDYIGVDKESNRIFDLTSEAEAKKNNILNPKAKYGPIVICIGEKQVLPGLDKFLVGKDVNREYAIDISPEEGFGKKDPKLMRLVPFKIFKKENIRPFPGLQINIDNMIGTIRTVSGGRVIVDFNHPLAGHHLNYKIKINKLITDEKTKIESLLKMITNSPKVEVIKDNSPKKADKVGTKVDKGALEVDKDRVLIAEVTLDMPEQIQKQLKEAILRTVPTIKDLKFKAPSKK